MVTKLKKTKTAIKKLVLLDAHAILHRAYHALPEFMSAKGEPTGGLYGVVTMLIKIIGELKPDYIIACYDLPDTTFRKQLYDNYKAGRKKADEALVAQMIRSRDVFTAFNIPIYDKPGFEADDILGTIVEETKNNKEFQVIIASGDMDTLQLVDDDRVMVYTLKKGINDTILYNEKLVRERFGFGPELLPDYKGLRGDPSDNIIGIAGIGEKTATDLIVKFGTIENIYKHLEKGRELLIRQGVKERVVHLLEEGKEEALFSKTLATIRRNVPLEFSLPAQPWREGVELKQIDTLFADLSFRTLGARVKSALSDAPVMAVSSREAKTKTVSEEVPRHLAIALWLLNSELTNPTLEDLLGFTRAESLDQARDYLLAEITKEGLEKVYREIELPLIPIIKEAEERGVLVDVDYLRELSKKYHEVLTGFEKKIYELAGTEFNINSPKQLGEVLFDQLRLTAKGLKKTDGGARSTRESELQKLIEVHPVIAEILKYRELQKVLSTYVDTIPAQVDEKGRLHTHLNQTGTTTGRMSSNSPNLQNIPASEGLGTEIRRAFLVPPGYVWGSFDYSQIEMRVLAMLAEEDELVRVFKAGEDVHTAVAMRVFKVPASEVTKDMRRKAKVINFGIVYGMGVNALKQNLGSSRAEAQEFYNNFFLTFPKIESYFESVKTFAAKKGYTETLFGRRRYFPGMKSPIPYIKAMNERMAINAPLQGTAADIVKLAMIKVDEKLRAAKLHNNVHFLLQVHDELIFEIRDEVKAEAIPLIKEAMETAITASVPIVANAALGPNWAETK